MFCLCCSERGEGGGGKGAKAKWISKPSWAKKRKLNITIHGQLNKYCTLLPWQRPVGNSQSCWPALVAGTGGLLFLCHILLPPFLLPPSLSLSFFLSSSNQASSTSQETKEIYYEFVSRQEPGVWEEGGRVHLWGQGSVQWSSPKDAGTGMHIASESYDSTFRFITLCHQYVFYFLDS